MTNSFVHTELSTDNVDAASKFYKAIFKWKMQNLGPDMGNYTMIDFGKKDAGAGIQAKMMPNQPTAWLPYVEVKSVKDTMAKAVKAGAKVMVAYQAVGDMGALGIFIDPTGAALGIWERALPPKKSAKKKSAKKKSTSKKSTSKKSTSKKSSSKKPSSKNSGKKKSAKKSAKKKSAKGADKNAKATKKKSKAKKRK